MAQRRNGLKNHRIKNGNGKPVQTKVAKTGGNKSKSLPILLRSIKTPVKGKISYVLDTNIYLHDYTAIFSFDEHDVYVLSDVLEELDNHKNGRSAEAMNSRHTSRIIDEHTSRKTPDQLKKGVKLIPPAGLEDGKPHNGMLFFYFNKPSIPKESNFDLDHNKADHRMIMACLDLKKAGKRVIFITKDLNARILARNVGIEAEDYLNEAATDIIGGEEVENKGFLTVPEDVWEEAWGVNGNPEVNNVDNVEQYTVTHKFFKQVNVNTFLLLPKSKKMRVIKKQNQTRIVVESMKNHRDIKASRASAKNPEQKLALQLLLDPKIEIMSIAGMAGSGKTYLALVTAL